MNSQRGVGGSGTALGWPARAVLSDQGLCGGTTEPHGCGS